MSKFSSKTATANRAVRPTTPITTTGPATTYEGGQGYSLDTKSELFLLSVTNFGAENTYYESANDRDKRFRSLVQKVTTEDPEWLQKFIPWLRDTANMRTASVIAAAEYVKAGGPNSRQVVAKTLIRADEPAEILGYWIQTHGRALPQPLKRGVADAARRLYTEYNLLKYDGQARGFRFGDVIDLTHPTPADAKQSALFRHALDRRHSHDESVPEVLEMLNADRYLLRLPEGERRKHLLTAPNQLKDAGWTWERLAGWIPGGMDAAAWEAVIPQMGYMALLRNLRNFDEANISSDGRDFVASKLRDPAEVARSRQFPFRFLSAYKAAPSLTWGPVLEEALDLSVQNIPELSGRTLVLVDVSGSMMAPLSRRSSVMAYEVGALFAVATYKRSGGKADLAAFASTSEAIRLSKATSVLRGTHSLDKIIGRIGYGTEAYTALASHYDNHDRVVIFTDMQVFPHGQAQQKVADSVPVLYTFDLRGYGRAAFEAGKPGRHIMGGFSDSTFKLMDAVERYESAGWDALFSQ